MILIVNPLSVVVVEVTSGNEKSILLSFIKLLIFSTSLFTVSYAFFVPVNILTILPHTLEINPLIPV